MGTSFGLAKGLLVIMIFFWMIELLPNRDNADIIIKKSNLAQKLIYARKSIITTFDWDDPVDLGEKTIREFLNMMEENRG